MRVLTLDVSRGARGRPGKPWHSLPNRNSFAYLVRLSKKHEIETSGLFNHIVDAWLKGKSSFGDISVTRRQITEDHGVFLITRDGQIMTQLRLTSEMLRLLKETELDHFQFVGYASTKSSLPEPEDLAIKDLCFRTRRFNLEATIVEKSTPRTVLSRSGKELLLSTATIKDESGTTTLSLWNDHIDTFSVGDIIRIENALVKRFHGELRIAIDKHARLRTIQRESPDKSQSIKELNQEKMTRSSEDLAHAPLPVSRKQDQ